MASIKKTFIKKSSFDISPTPAYNTLLTSHNLDNGITFVSPFDRIFPFTLKLYPFLDAF